MLQQLFLFMIFISFGNCELKSASVTWDPSSKKYTLRDGVVQKSVASAVFRNEINSTGWSFLDVVTSELYPDDVQAYAAGAVEGYITASLIKMHWANTVQGYCTEPLSPYCLRLKKFLKTNLDWMNSQIKSQNGETDYWNMVENFLIQVDGLNDGYMFNMEQDGVLPGWSTDIDPFGMYMFQVDGDLEDLEAVLNRDQKTRVLGSGSCSALIRMYPGNKDVYVSHDTWNSFQSMLRILKRYDFAFHSVNKGYVPGRKMTFSSYPGTIYSGDDYYLISSGLATLETTIGNSNANLWKFVKPENTVLEVIRTMVSNRLAVTGASWTDIFKQMNSGTYNNQWMIVDYKKFVSGTYNMSGLLYVLEQIPGYTESADVTDVLMKQSYWPSYNIPYFPKVFNMSGGNEAVQKYGDWFSYNGSPRAKIFHRDFSKVTDMKSMIKLMRYNDFTHDPLSKCNCTPPYSGENAISARSDLNPANGKYPFGALGHRSHGGTDMKLTNHTLFQNLEFVAVSGPTFDQQPPFQWSQADFANSCPHQGHPDLFKFDPIQYDGTVQFKPFQG